MTCRARQYSDEMHCAACRLRWDTNDPEPPACPQMVKAPPIVPERAAMKRKREAFVSALPPDYFRYQR